MRRRDYRRLVEIDLFIEPEIFEPLQKYHGLAAARTAFYYAVFGRGTRDYCVLIGLNSRNNVGEPFVAALDFEHVREKFIVNDPARFRRIILKHRHQFAVAYIELAPEHHFVYISAVFYRAVFEPVVYAVAERRVVRINDYPVLVKYYVRSDVYIRFVAEKIVTVRNYAGPRHGRRIRTHA